MHRYFEYFCFSVTASGHHYQQINMDRFFEKKSSAYNKQCYINSKAVQLKANEIELNVY